MQNDKAQVTFYYVPGGFLSTIVQDIRLISRDLRGFKKQMFQENAVFPVAQDFGLFFLVLSSVTNLTEQFIRVQKVFLAFFYTEYRLW